MVARKGRPHEVWDPLPEGGAIGSVTTAEAKDVIAGHQDRGADRL